MLQMTTTLLSLAWNASRMIISRQAQMMTDTDSDDDFQVMDATVALRQRGT